MCLCVCYKAEKARLIGVPDQILEKTEGKRSKRE